MVAYCPTLTDVSPTGTLALMSRGLQFPTFGLLLM
jgi:hypothetical protein